MIRTCKWCDELVTDDDTDGLWVSVMLGGNYDYCEASPEPEFDDRHHEPSTDYAQVVADTHNANRDL